MTKPREKGVVPRISLRIPVEAARAMGVGEDAFNEHVRPHLRLTPVGSKVTVVAVAELERWLARNGAIPGERQ